ncbi:MAG TPA: cysteine peptidase family C39 domain-containing protein [Patescibacteria group bacterium]|nr:cysteine peptidase family C39 domain-containing protein [Patescibacteria group bacterium]
MEINGNKAYRKIVRNLLALQDKVTGVALPKMARMKQIDNYSCGAAVIAMLYSFLGVRVSQKGMIASLRAQKKIKRFGLNTKDLARAVKIAGKGGFIFWKKANATTRDLISITEKHKFPVGVEWQGVFYEDADEDDGHYAIVTQVNKEKGYLRIADPFRKFAGVDRRFKIKDFLKRWWDQNDISIAGTSKKRRINDRRVMFVITPKGETWPKKLGMVKAL